MTVYAITTDGFKYKELDLVVDDFLEAFPEEFSYKDAHQFDRLNLTLGGFWPSMKTGFCNITGGENLIPEVTLWRDTTLVLSPAAYRYVYDLLKSYGEFLPIEIDDTKSYIFNCTATAEVGQAKTNQNNIVFDKQSVSNKVIFKCLHPDGLGFYCGEKFKKFI